MTPVDVASWLLIGASLLLAALVISVVGRKVLRDRSEAASRIRRDTFAAALETGSVAGLEPLLAAGVRSVSARRDLVTVLSRTPVSAASAPLHDAVRRVGLDAALTGAVEDRDAPGRGLAVLLACRLRLPGAPDLASRRLADPDPDVRLAAAAGLSRLGTPAAARSLISALDHPTLPPERIIERLGGAWAVPELVRALESAPHPGEDEQVPPLRASLARAIGLAGSTRGEPALLWLLRTGAFEERIAAARALGACGTARAVPHLVAVLEDEAWQLRVQAIRSLGTLGAATAAGRLGELLADSAWWVRAAAADALRELGAAGLAELQAALHHPDRYARDRAREALALEGLVAAETARREAA